MKINTKCHYGTRAMLEIARNYEDGTPIKCKDITASQGLPCSYLQNILLELRGAGLLIAERGPNGGFVLSRPPNTITVYDIVSALTGNDASSVQCLRSDCTCENQTECISKQVWIAMQKAQDEVLKKFDLQSLIESKGKGMENIQFLG